MFRNVANHRDEHKGDDAYSNRSMVVRTKLAILTTTKKKKKKPFMRYK